jgi:hypothetical protein
MLMLLIWPCFFKATLTPSVEVIERGELSHNSNLNRRVIVLGSTTVDLTAGSQCSYMFSKDGS